MCVYMCMYVCHKEGGVPAPPAPGAGCELSNMGARNKS